MGWKETTGFEPLVKYIRNKIQTSPHRAISFRDFMDCCLYHDPYGYYMNSRTKVGKEGDFYTSSAIGNIMGEILAKYMVDLFEQDPKQKKLLSIVEWGGGTGRLAGQILDELKHKFPAHYAILDYTIIEQSPFHKTLQRELLIEHESRVCFKSPDEWFESGSKEGSMILSNELLDAFPVHRLQFIHHCLHEIYVVWDEQHQAFREKLLPMENEELNQYILAQELVLREGQIYEINLAASEWIKQIGDWMKSGHVLTIDYGDVSKEIYAEHRMNGTLMCYRKHQAQDDPYQYIGVQDITAHIDFSALIAAGEQAGFTGYSLQTQKDFLIKGGILDKLQDHPSGDPFHPIAKKNRAIRQILVSDQMSELFKVLVQTR
ncbi:MAG TPA: SAM-dependent methyltransferase [Bacilli bacterium]